MTNEESYALSHSSMKTFLSCQRKFWFKKIGKYPVDPDIEEDTEALRVGKTFHQILEDTGHILDGLKYSSVVAECWKQELDEDEFAPMIYAMLSRYKVMHEKSGLKASFCEVEVKTPDFIGFIDVILTDNEGGWWLGDMKTSAAYYSNIAAGLPRNQQLNLYASYADLIGDQLKLDLSKFKGCRYRVTTKSKLARNTKRGETIEEYISRLCNSVKSVEFIIPKEKLDTSEARRIHKLVHYYIMSKRALEEYLPNYDSCTQYFKPCEFWSQCHNAFHSEIKLESISASDD